MTPLDELLVKWHDRSLTAREQVELNGWLTTFEGRARLRDEFGFDANLLVAVQVERARAHAHERARAFQTIEVRRHHVFGRSRRQQWLAFLMELAGLRWKMALLAVVCAVVLAVVSGIAFRGRTLARIEGEAGAATVLRGGKPIVLTRDTVVRSGDQIQTSAGGGATVIFLKELTRLELQGSTQVRVESTDDGKRLELRQGAMTVKAAPQPKGQPMVVMTPHAEAKVLGTEFLLAVTAQSSRLEVLDGTVQFASREDGRAVVVNGGFFATAAKGVEMAARSLLPGPWHSQDIGDVGLPGVARLDGSRCTAKGAGRNSCRTKDQFHFVYQPLEGDGEIIARVVNLEMAHPGAKAGVVMRENLKASALSAFLFCRPGSGVEFERRPKLESKTARVGNEAAPCWVRLARQGDVVTAYTSSDGVSWSEAAWERIQMGPRIYVGLGVTSWDNSALATSVFDHVSALTAARSDLPSNEGSSR